MIGSPEKRMSVSDMLIVNGYGFGDEIVYGKSMQRMFFGFYIKDKCIGCERCRSWCYFRRQDRIRDRD